MPKTTTPTYYSFNMYDIQYNHGVRYLLTYYSKTTIRSIDFSLLPNPIFKPLLIYYLCKYMYQYGQSIVRSKSALLYHYIQHFCVFSDFYDSNTSNFVFIFNLYRYCRSMSDNNDTVLFSAQLLWKPANSSMYFIVYILTTI